MKRISCFFLCLVLLVCSLTGCKREVEAKSKVYYEYFGTVSAIFSYAEDTAEVFDARCERIRKRLEYYHRLFDIYYEYSGVTNLRSINRAAGEGAVKVDAELVDFLLYAKEDRKSVV